MKPTVAIYHDIRYKSRLPEYKGKSQIKIRVTFKIYKKGKLTHDPRYYDTGSTSHWVTPEEFEQVQQLSPRLPDIKKIRKDVVDAESRANDIIDKLQVIDRITFETHFTTKGSLDSIETLFNIKINECDKNGQISNASIYRSAISVLKQFAGDYIHYHQVTPKWLNDFKEWYLEKGHSLTALCYHLRALRHIFRTAMDPPYRLVSPDQYPFGKGRFMVPRVKKAVKAHYTVEQKNKFIKFKTKDPDLHYYHSIALFSYFSNGMNPADIAHLKRKAIFTDHIEFDRRKKRNTTSEKRAIIIPLRKEHLAVIAKYGNKSLDPDEYVFPIINSTMTEKQKHTKINNFVRHMNAALKVIAEELKLPHIKTYGIRHTFSFVAMMLGASTELLQDMLGHETAATTEEYKHGFSLRIKKKLSRGL